MVFNEIDNFIEVYNNSVIELIQCFGTSLFGRIDHLASSVIKFRPKNSVPKHCIRSITYNYYRHVKWMRVVLLLNTGIYTGYSRPIVDCKIIVFNMSMLCRKVVIKHSIK